MYAEGSRQMEFVAGRLEGRVTQSEAGREMQEGTGRHTCRCAGSQTDTRIHLSRQA
jgi:hypothetical protein